MKYFLTLSCSAFLLATPAAIAGEVALMPHVETNAALKDLKSTAYTTVVRDGFTTPGDGGGATYTSSNVACSLNGGDGDDRSEVKSADNKCWLAAPFNGTTNLSGLVTNRAGGFGGFAQNLITLNDSAHTTGTPPYTPPIIGLEVDVLSTVGGVTSDTTHIGVIGYSTLKTTPFTYTAGLQEYWQGGFFLGGATTGCGGALPATPCGTFWGLASVVTLYSGATGMDAVVSAEFDVATYAGSSTNSRVGVLIVDLDSTVGAGVGYDAALEITATAGAVKFRTGVDFGGLSGASPVTATGTLIGASTVQSVGEIIDLHNVTCTGTNALKFANGFAVTCSGALQIPVAGLPTVAAGTGKNFLCIDPATGVVYRGTGASCV